MSVRGRLLGSAAVLAAAVVTSAAHAQQFGPQGFPVPAGGGKTVSKDQVQAALERLGKQLPTQNTFGLPPDLFNKLVGDPTDAKREFTPEEKAKAEELLKNPAFKQLAEEMARRQKARPNPPPVPPDGNPRVPPVGDPPPAKTADRIPRPPVGDPPPIGPRVAPPDRVPPKVRPGDPPPFPEFGKGPNPPDGVRPAPDGPRPPMPPFPQAQQQFPPRPLPGAEKMPWQHENPQDKARQAVAALWENNIGPLHQTPEVQKALFGLADGAGEWTGPDGNSLWDSFAKEFGDGKSFADLFKGTDGFDPFGPGDGMNWPDWEFPKFNWNFNWGNGPDVGPDGGGGKGWFDWLKRTPSTSSPSSAGGGSSWFSGWKAPNWNVGIPALDGTWLPVLFLVLALIGGVFLWRYLARYNGGGAGAIDPYALGPWPVDPHRLATRQDVVVAFEHLSVLLCGPAAKTWTHTTIAAALTEFARAEPARALLLARLYELARYTPVEEPLTTHELAEARLIVCRLAGLGDE